MTSSYPAMLHMTYKYASKGDEESKSDKGDAFLKGVMANANRGGENVATGTLQGAILGGACGYKNLPRRLLDGLAPKDKDKLESEVEAFLSTLPLLADKAVTAGSL